MPPDATRRLFVAIDLPAHTVEGIRRLVDPALEVRWSPADQYHLTLRFLGDTPEAQVEPLAARLAAVRAPAFELRVEGVGAFPSIRRPRVLVVHVAHDPALLRLREEVEAAVLELGFQPDDRPFRAHVTVGRVKGAKPREVRRYLQARRPLALEPFRADAFSLYESRRHPEGAEHHRLQEVPLATSGNG